MLHCEIVLFFIFAYKQKAPSFAEIRRMCAFDHIKWYDYSHSFFRLDRTDLYKRTAVMLETVFPGTQTFLPLFANDAEQPLPSFISTQLFITKPEERGSKAHSPVFAWCLFGVYYYSEILSAVPTYPPKTAWTLTLLQLAYSGKNI